MDAAWLQGSNGPVQRCLLAHSLTYQRASPQMRCGGKQQQQQQQKKICCNLTNICCVFRACDPRSATVGACTVIITGGGGGGGEGEQPVDWRAASRSTVNSFRQNIKVLQQLLRVPRLKSEQRQAHGELLLLPGKWILLRVPRVSCTFSLPSSQSNSKYFISLHQERVCVCMYRFNYIGKTPPAIKNEACSLQVINPPGRLLEGLPSVFWS